MTTPSTSIASVQESLPQSSPEPAVSGGAIAMLVAALGEARIRYCHWKSNARLSEALAGEGDLDLLVARADATRFQAVLAELGFKPGRSGRNPSICHYYGFDRRSGRLVHVHAYYRIVTGGTMLKNHRLPIEDMLLDGARTVDGVPVPDRAAELVSFVVRKSLEYATIGEALYLVREGEAVPSELRWLGDGVTDVMIGTLLREHLPTVDVRLFLECRDAMAAGSPLRRYLAARRLASSLSHYRRHSKARAAAIRFRELATRFVRRAVRRVSKDKLLSGGAVIAVVGSDGAGKSTVAHELSRWLSTCLSAKRIHAGRPPASLGTIAARLALPLLRRVMPRYKKSALEVGRGSDRAERSQSVRKRRLFLLYPLRAVMVAHERKRLLVRAQRSAIEGTIIVSDRYPHLQPDVPEGPALSFLLDDPNLFYAWLARVEQRVYRAMPRPDLVVYLDVPVDLACHRNLTRDKPGGPKPTGYVRRRHAQAAELEFAGVPVHHVDAAGELDQTLAAVREVVWKSL